MSAIDVPINHSNSPAVDRERSGGVTGVLVLLWAMALALLYFAPELYLDAIILPGIAYLIWHGVLLMGLVRRHPWARWALLTEIGLTCMLTCVRLPADLYIEMRDNHLGWEQYYLTHVWNEERIRWLLYFLALGVAIAVLLHNRVRREFRIAPDYTYRPSLIVVASLFLIVAGSACFLYGTYECLTGAYSAGCRPQITDEILFSYCFPSALLAVIGCGYWRMEAWTRRFGSGVLIVLIPYLLFYTSRLFGWFDGAGMVYLISHLLTILAILLLHAHPDVTRGYEDACYYQT